MPFYHYQCQACGHELEAMQRISDDPLKDCPECGASELKKLLTAPQFRLKGAGWYETDFKTGKKKNLVESGTDKKDTAKPAKEKSSAPAADSKKAASS